MRTITFNELRKIKDSLPSGSMHRIADELGLHVDTVRNFFGGHNFKEGKSVGIHLEPGPDGGLRLPSGKTPGKRTCAPMTGRPKASSAGLATGSARARSPSRLAPVSVGGEKESLTPRPSP